jgi:hypothetical protein
VSTTLVANAKNANLPPVSTTQGKMVAKFDTGVVDTGGKFAAGVVDTGGNLVPVSLTPVANLPPVSLIPMVHLGLRISPQISGGKLIHEKNRKQKIS